MDPSTNDFVWDVETVLEGVDGDVEDLKNLLSIWMRQTPRLLKEIRTALDQQDAEAIHLAAHTLKGSLQILRVQDQCSAVLDLEKAGRLSQLSDADALLKKLEDQIQVVIPQLTAFMTDN